MKPRIEKKLSKKLALIVGDKIGKVWIDSELELFPPHWRDRFGDHRPPLTTKEQRENWQTKVRVNHMPSIGGELDYWGEGTDYNSVFYCVREWLRWDIGEPQYSIDSEGDVWTDWPKVKDRLTGAWVIRKARQSSHRMGVRH